MRVLSVAIIGLAITLPVAAQRQTPRPSSPTQPRPAAPRDAAVPFKIGETLTYDVSWSQFITAGTATARVVEKKSAYGSPAYSVVAEGRPVPLVARFYQVYYKMETLLDSASLLSQFTSLYAEESGKKRQTNMRFDRTKRRVFYEAVIDPAFKEDFATPTNVQDGLATLYATRGRAFRAGEHFDIPVADDGSLYTVGIDVSGPEPVYVPLGTISAWNLRLSILDADKKPAASDSALWISNDARRLPIKMQTALPIGKFVLALREATP